MNNIVVKDVSLVNASYNLNLVEQRLILLAIIEARHTGKGIDANTPLIVSAANYMEQFGTHRVTAYEALKNACNVLFNRYFIYQEKVNGKTKNVKSRWVSRIAYIDELAQVELIFAPDVVPLITELGGRFSQYAINQISELRSAYAIRLYEILIAWRKSGKTPTLSLMDLRSRLGVSEGEYSRTEAFKRRVLDGSITQINQHTDITVSYQQHKDGRVITAFTFIFEFKHAPKQEEPLTPAKPTQSDQEAAYQEAIQDITHYKRMAQLANVPIETLLPEKLKPLYNSLKQ